MLCSKRSAWVSNAFCLSAAWLLLVLASSAQLMPHQNPTIPENGNSSADAESGRRELREKMEKRLTGTEQVFDKPRKFKT